jgi:hypothetical protein
MTVLRRFPFVLLLVGLLEANGQTASFRADTLRVNALLEQGAALESQRAD